MGHPARMPTEAYREKAFKAQGTSLSTAFVNALESLIDLAIVVFGICRGQN